MSEIQCTWTFNPMQKTAMHYGSVVSLCFEGKWPPRCEHFASRYGFSILADFCPARETFNILHTTGRSLTTFSGKNEVIAFVTDETMIHDDRVSKTFWNESHLTFRTKGQRPRET